MSLWGFSKEFGQVVAGANNVAGKIAGQQPFSGKGDGRGVPKRNVIVTNLGWVRRQNKVDMHGTLRQMDEVLVAANPAGGTDGYANTAYLGTPDITQIYVSSNSTGGSALQRSATANLYVVFNEAIRHRGGTGFIRVRVANTVTGNTLIATANAVSGSAGQIINANNTLVFKFVPGVAGTYKVNSNTLVFSSVSGGTFAANLVSYLSVYRRTNGGTVTEAANCTITGAVSNNMGTFTVRTATTGG